MNFAKAISIRNRPPVVIAGLTVFALLGFLGVNRLVNRFAEQEKALARHLYAEGLAAQAAGQLDRAIERYRAALTYSHDNFQYQLSLARTLRDTGRTTEAESYLIGLWEHAPQDAAVNLALARLAARERSIDKAIQYYHNAIYGVWGANPDNNRLNVWFELVEFLLQQGARPQAQGELITLAAEIPHDADLQLRLASLFGRAQDNEHALAGYQRVLATERANPAALAGAGEAAFNLGRYRTAQRYLQGAAQATPTDAQVTQLLDICNLMFQADPFSQGISRAERNRRIRTAFKQAGERLDSCIQAKGIDAVGPFSSGLGLLKSQWVGTQPQLMHRSPTSEEGDRIMELVFQIEQQTQAECGPPTGINEALLLLAQNRAGVDQ